MKIGVFVPQKNSKYFKSILKHYKSVDFSFFPYKNFNEVRKSFQNNEPFLDGFFFTGYLSYTTIKNAYGDFEKPAMYLKIQEADFFRKMFEVTITDPSIELSRVFFDFHVETSELENILYRIPKERRPYIPIVENHEITDDVYDQIFEMHDRLHKENKVDWSFTRFSNIIPRLEENKYKHHYFELSEETIHRTLVSLMNEINFRTLEDTQVACGRITISATSHEVRQIKMLNLHSLLLDYNQKNRSSLVITENESEFEILTTRGTLLSSTDSFSSCKLLQFLTNYMDETIHIGWGFGQSFSHTRENAKRALSYSVNNEFSSTFIITNTDEIIGPILKTSYKNNPKQQAISQENITTIINKTNLSRDKMNKIVTAFTELNQKQISSAQFAEILGVTVRTANRILNEAVIENVLYATDETVAGLQGRPRKLYAINELFFNDPNLKK